MVVHIAEQEAARGFVDDDPDVRARSHRPEIFIPRLVEAVEAHARIRRVHLEVEGRGLDRLLLVAV